MTQSRKSAERFLALARSWAFPLGVLCLYGLGLLLVPERTHRAIGVSVAMFRQLALPLCFAAVVMMIFNRFFSRMTVSRFLGKKAGLKGVLLSSLAGVLSMGPIYAWYPLFKTLKEGGASRLIVANFIGCRSVKPALFPILLAYFGWSFSLLFVAFNLAGAFMVACVVNMACPSGDEKTGRDEFSS